MFKKLLASVGIGSAEVDFRLHTDNLFPGEKFEGSIHIKGGKTEQEITGINLLIKTTAESETDSGTLRVPHTVQTIRINEKFVCRPGEDKVINVRAFLIPEVPVTSVSCPNNTVEVWFQTELDVEMALDPTDRDYVHVHPTQFIASFLGAMQNLGFHLFATDVESGQLNGPNFRSTTGCYQEFEFKPGFPSTFNEVEVSFVPEEERTHVLLEVDIPGRGDVYVSETFDNSMDTHQIEAYIKQWLSL